jgi:hypothetical protein
MKTHETAYGYIEDGKVFLKGFLDFPERNIGVVKETEEAAIAYFEKRYETAKEKVAELKKLIEEAENKGSYLMKLIHMRQYLTEFKGLGDFPLLFTQLDELEEYLRNLVANNRVKNLQIKQDLVKEAEDLIESQEWEETALKFKDIKLRWIKTGPIDKEANERLEAAFNAALKAFFSNRKLYFKKRNDEIRDKVKHYRQIIDKANQLKYSDDFEATALAFRDLQNEWKEVGKIPKSKMASLWERFKKVNNDFFYRYKQYKAGATVIRPLNATELLKVKQEELCKKAESLIGNTSEEALNKAKELLVNWKKVTTNPKLIDKALARRFRLLCDRIFEEGYLIRLIKRKYPDYDDKPQLDQYKIKTSYMRELIRREEMEIKVEENVEEPMDSQKEYNLNVRKRKLQVKKAMLQEFEEKLRNF